MVGPHNEITTSCKEVGAVTTLVQLFLQTYNFGVFQQNPPMSVTKADFAVPRKWTLRFSDDLRPSDFGSVAFLP
jgi:hypothetical protein